MTQRFPNDAPPPGTVDEVEIIATEFLAQLRIGQKPDRQALLDAYPHLGARLQKRLELAELIFRVGLAPDNGGTSSRATEIRSAGQSEAGSPTNTTSLSEEPAAGRPRPANPPGYEILAEVGHGGMGVVYKARQLNLNRIVALKMIRAGSYASPQLLARFHLEAETLASLQHPNIVPIYEVGEHDGCPFMAMEFLDGGSLGEALGGRPQPPEVAARLVERLARAMHAAHLRGIVHRDLKPANVLLQGASGQGSGVSGDNTTISLTPDPSPLTPKIVDFGLAKRLVEGEEQTTTGAVLGTPSYMAPEQAGGRVREIGPLTDVYALGAILYEMLTGRPPFQGETPLDTITRVVSQEPIAPRRLSPGLPRDLEIICLKCLQKDPRKRYASAEALAEDLRRFAAGEPISARPAGVSERAWKWARRRPALAALLAVCAAAALALAVEGTLWSIQVRAERDRTRHSLDVARQAINDLYTKMASERLFDEPQLDPLCQELLEKAQRLNEELAREHSDNIDVQRESALAWFRIARIRSLREQLDAAEQAYGEAISRQEKLSHDFPEEPRYREELADSHNWLGELLRERQRPPHEAEGHYRAARDLQQALFQAFPEEASYLSELARSHYNLGIICKDTNHLAEAQANYDRSVELLSGMSETERARPGARQDLARALINRGVLDRLRGQLDEAGRDYQHAIELLTSLHQEFPARAVYRFELAVAHQDLGNLFWSLHRHQDARQEQERSLTLLRELIASYPTRPQYQKKMATTLKNLGTDLAALGDLAGAERYYQEARTFFEKLAREHADAGDYHFLLGQTLGNLAWVRTEQKNWPEARRLIEQGLVQIKAALAPNPQHPDYRQELRNQYQDLAETLVQLGDHAAAKDTAQKLASVFPERAQDSYYAACFTARCIPLARKEGKSIHRYGEQAVALLQQAANHASPELKRLPEEQKIFQPLAGYPAFAAARQALDVKVSSGKATP